MRQNALPPMHGSRLFRSACSGLWYLNPKAAGSIDAVEIKGRRIFRNEDEPSLEWIDRVTNWAAKIHSENDKITHGPEVSEQPKP